MTANPRPPTDSGDNHGDDRDEVRDDHRDDVGYELALAEASRILALVDGLLGDVPMLSVRVERDTIPVRVPAFPWPRHVRSVDVAVHCATDEPAAEVANRLGLSLIGTRRFASERVGVEFVESTWAGWLTTPAAAMVALPVSVTVSGSALVPTPLRRDIAGTASMVEAVA
ncbi:hypothetical protein [Terrabacter carboxydivorans]|uniref:Uncharacterized protein n=1 Tax=Terrabacter carboxydivorans TaxID=619730 RepID=A0ABN3MBA0_9MICO